MKKPRHKHSRLLKNDGVDIFPLKKGKNWIPTGSLQHFVTKARWEPLFLELCQAFELLRNKLDLIIQRLQNPRALTILLSSCFSEANVCLGVWVSSHVLHPSQPRLDPQNSFASRFS